MGVKIELRLKKNKIFFQSIILSLFFIMHWIVIKVSPPNTQFQVIASFIILLLLLAWAIQLFILWRRCEK